MRSKYENLQYRLLAFWDKRNNKDILVVCTHGIVKKTDKMNSANIKLYDLFRNDLKLDETKAREFVEAIDNTISQEVRQDKTEIATKDFVKREITEAKNDMIKWFVGLFFALALMIIGLYIKK